MWLDLSLKLRWDLGLNLCLYGLCRHYGHFKYTLLCFNHYWYLINICCHCILSRCYEYICSYIGLFFCKKKCIEPVNLLVNGKHVLMRFHDFLEQATNLNSILANNSIERTANVFVCMLCSIFNLLFWMSEENWDCCHSREQIEKGKNFRNLLIVMKRSAMSCQEYFIALEYYITRNLKLNVVRAHYHC